MVKSGKDITYEDVGKLFIDDVVKSLEELAKWCSEKTGGDYKYAIKNIAKNLSRYKDQRFVESLLEILPNHVQAHCSEAEF